MGNKLAYRFLRRFAAAVLIVAASDRSCHAQIQLPAHVPGSPVALPPGPGPLSAISPHLIAYLFAGQQSNYTVLSKTIRFGKITDLYLAFANPPKCQGACTPASDMRFSIDGETDADIDTIVHAAHAAGVRVVASIGGGGGDQRIIQFYNAGLTEPVVASLRIFVSAHNLDGVDLDIEDPSNMGGPYLTFTSALIAALHPDGKVVTAAVAKYLQGSMPEAALRQFDLLNIMNYSSYVAAISTRARKRSLQQSSSSVFRSSVRAKMIVAKKAIRTSSPPIPMPGKSIWLGVDRSTMGWHSTTSASRQWRRRQNWEKGMVALCFGI